MASTTARNWRLLLSHAISLRLVDERRGLVELDGAGPRIGGSGTGSGTGPLPRRGAGRSADAQATARAMKAYAEYLIFSTSSLLAAPTGTAPAPASRCSVVPIEQVHGPDDRPRPGYRTEPLLERRAMWVERHSPASARSRLSSQPALRCSSHSRLASTRGGDPASGRCRRERRRHRQCSIKATTPIPLGHEPVLRVGSRSPVQIFCRVGPFEEGRVKKAQRAPVTA